MYWGELKSRILANGGARLSGCVPPEYISSSSAGPGAGGSGSVFFSRDGRRVRIALNDRSDMVITCKGGEAAVLSVDGEDFEGYLEKVPFHCPRQAFITVSSGCTFGCRYCSVPLQPGRRKSIDEIEEMVRSVKEDIDAISITSGVLCDVREEEEYVLSVVERLGRFGLPIGVSIYPTLMTPERLRSLGVVEVKFNIETATPGIFRRMCPGLDRDLIIEVLRRSVQLFGRNRVFSNVIAGLGETDEELASCIRMLAGMGVIPVIRPLNPVAGTKNLKRPGADRLRKIAAIHKEELEKAGLDAGQAVTMCAACTGCDLVPGRDL